MSNLSIGSTPSQQMSSEKPQSGLKPKKPHALKELIAPFKKDKLDIINPFGQFGIIASSSLISALPASALSEWSASFLSSQQKSSSVLASGISGVAGALVAANLTDDPKRGSVYGAITGALIGGATASLTSGANVLSITQGIVSSATVGAIGGATSPVLTSVASDMADSIFY